MHACEYKYNVQKKLNNIIMVVGEFVVNVLQFEKLKNKHLFSYLRWQIRSKNCHHKIVIFIIIILTSRS